MVHIAKHVLKFAKVISCIENWPSNAMPSVMNVSDQTVSHGLNVTLILVWQKDSVLPFDPSHTTIICNSDHSEIKQSASFKDTLCILCVFKKQMPKIYWNPLASFLTCSQCHWQPGLKPGSQILGLSLKGVFTPYQNFNKYFSHSDLFSVQKLFGHHFICCFSNVVMIIYINFSVFLLEYDQKIQEIWCVKDREKNVIWKILLCIIAVLFKYVKRFSFTVWAAFGCFSMLFSITNTLYIH